ncbi:hypothetical protein G6F64_014010 [Rhizopus arrhizus]|uniref:Uncharacterized protein n=1 Tax=Rhizopus oryzae TaxID=64495 RepID=A0A9P6WUH6_RHIOR|nr:hypothetical protein G6F64_014010 [Rhizopus arrhizus]
MAWLYCVDQGRHPPERNAVPAARGKLSTAGWVRVRGREPHGCGDRAYMDVLAAAPVACSTPPFLGKPAFDAALAVASAGAGRSPAGPHANNGAWRCSRRSSAALVSRPPPRPVSAPLLPMTRWQGRMIGNGLRPLAAPTARVALGCPRCCARSR